MSQSGFYSLLFSFTKRFVSKVYIYVSINMNDKPAYLLIPDDLKLCLFDRSLSRQNSGIDALSYL